MSDVIQAKTDDSQRLRIRFETSPNGMVQAKVEGKPSSTNEGDRPKTLSEIAERFKRIGIDSPAPEWATRTVLESGVPPGAMLAPNPLKPRPPYRTIPTDQPNCVQVRVSDPFAL